MNKCGHVRPHWSVISCLNLYSLIRRSGNIREVLIFANFVKRKNSRILESRVYYYYNNTTEEKLKFANSKFRENSENLQFLKIETRENYKISSIISSLFAFMEHMHTDIECITKKSF